MACRYNEYADVSKLIDDVNFSKTKHINVKKVDTLNICQLSFMIFHDTLAIFSIAYHYFNKFKHRPP